MYTTARNSDGFQSRDAYCTTVHAQAACLSQQTGYDVQAVALPYVDKCMLA